MRVGEAVGVDSLVYLRTYNQLAAASTCLELCACGAFRARYCTAFTQFKYLIVPGTQGLQGKGEGQGSVV